MASQANKKKKKKKKKDKKDKKHKKEPKPATPPADPAVPVEPEVDASVTSATLSNNSKYLAVVCLSDVKLYGTAPLTWLGSCPLCFVWC